MTRLLFTIAFALIFLPATAFAGCWRLPNGQIVQTSSNSTPPVRGAVRVDCPSVVTPTSPPRQQTGVTTFDRSRGAYDDNCVLFARSRAPSLPYGLESWSSKRAIINSNSPRAGSVAIIQVRGSMAQYGHVAVVESVTTNSITIVEANYGGPGIQRRRAVGRDASDAASQLGIVGYFRP